MKIDRARWTLDENTVALTSGFEAGRLYELSYESANPPVAGLGFAAVRDAAAWLRHPSDTPARVQRAIAGMLDEDVPAWVEGLPPRHRAWALEPKGPELPRWTDAGPEPAAGGERDA